MSSLPRWIKPLVALAILGALGYWGYRKVYAGPMALERDELNRYRTQIDGLQDLLKRHPPVIERLQAYSAQTLGRTPDDVDHRFRSSVNEIARKCGLEGVEVSTSEPTRVRSPIERPTSPIRSRVGKQIRDEFLKPDPGFAVVDGQVSGVGTLAQVLQLLAMLEKQAWVNRVTGVRLNPVGKNRGERFGVTIGIATLYMPKNAPEEPPVAVSLDPAQEETWASLVRKNPFRPPQAPEPEVESTPEPEPVAVEPEPVTPAPPPPPPPPYHEWWVTAVTHHPNLGVEVWLINRANGGRVILRPGEAILGATLVEASGERAVFEIEGKRYEVSNGQSLDRWRALN
jgi:hypothetical protein